MYRALAAFLVQRAGGLLEGAEALSSGAVAVYDLLGDELAERIAELSREAGKTPGQEPVERWLGMIQSNRCRRVAITGLDTATTMSSRTLERLTTWLIWLTVLLIGLGLVTIGVTIAAAE